MVAVAENVITKDQTSAFNRVEQVNKSTVRRRDTLTNQVLPVYMHAVRLYRWLIDTYDDAFLYLGKIDKALIVLVYVLVFLTISWGKCFYNRTSTRVSMYDWIEFAGVMNVTVVILIDSSSHLAFQPSGGALGYLYREVNGEFPHFWLVAVNLLVLLSLLASCLVACYSIEWNPWTNTARSVEVRATLIRCVTCLC